jgi:hypothetical protein
MLQKIWGSFEIRLQLVNAIVQKLFFNRHSRFPKRLSYLLSGCAEMFSLLNSSPSIEATRLELTIYIPARCRFRLPH